MTKHIIDGNFIRTEEDLHSYFYDNFDIPYYGRNMNALNDLLTGMLEGPLHFVWTSSEVTKKHMGKHFNEIVDFLKRIELLEYAEVRFDFI